MKVFEGEELATSIHHGLFLAIPINQQQRYNASGLSHPVIVGTEGGCNMNNTGTIAGGYEIATNDAESIPIWFHPWNQLFIRNAFQLPSFVLAGDGIRHLLVAGLVGFKITINIKVDIYTPELSLAAACISWSQHNI